MQSQQPYIPSFKCINNEKLGSLIDWAGKSFDNYGTTDISLTQSIPSFTHLVVLPAYT